MFSTRFLFFFLLLASGTSAQNISQFPLWLEDEEKPPATDWLLDTSDQYKAEIYRTADYRDLVLSNGLLERRFRISPDVACTDYKNLSNGQQVLRALAPEARLLLDGKTYQIGGLKGQTEKAYLLPEWLDGFSPWASDFKLEDIETEALQPYLNWKPRTWTANTQQAGGQTLIFTYIATAPEIAGIRVKIGYELYDGLPLLVKWLSIENGSTKTHDIGQAVSEILACVEGESAVGGNPETMRKPTGLYVETNYSFGTDVMRPDISSGAIHWKADSTYTSQVNYQYLTPCLLEIYPEKVSSISLKVGETFQSVRTCELLLDSYDRERRGLSVRKMYRTLAPWTTQNPIFMHLVSQNDQEVRDAVDQCVATGYEAIILSFGSHCNMEDNTAANIRRWHDLAEYAHSHGILLGGYALFSSRRISEADDVIDPVTGKTGHAIFGNAPCFGSRWGLDFAHRIQLFLEKTGFDIWENDGPYPGDVCASTTHPGHKNLGDSQWRQMEIQKDLYRWCNEHGVYVNAPDWYFLNGTNKIALGYREVNFSLSREQQKILNRQNIFDGTWDKTPSMGWGFVPLTRYQGGNDEAVLEPLNEHIADYHQLMMQYYGAGVQACYRGPRLYDTEETRKMVQQTIKWYKQNRDILNSDIIHLRRPDGRDWDGILHVNPAIGMKGFLLLFNPLKIPITRKIKIPLYYTGLRDKATFFNPELYEEMVAPINRNYEVELELTIPAEGMIYYIIY